MLWVNLTHHGSQGVNLWWGRLGWGKKRGQILSIMPFTGFHLLGGAGGKLPPQTLNLPPPPPPPKVIHKKYLVIHEKYLVTSSHSCYIISFRVFSPSNTE